MATPPYPCPACGFLTFTEPPGSYEICPVCSWENDHFGLRYPAAPVGPNDKSLVDLQKWVLKRFPVTMQRAGRHERDPAWRPLSPLEIQLLQLRNEAPDDYAEDASVGAPAYYWRRKR